MRRQAAWRMLLTAAFLLMPWVAQAEIDPATAQKLLAGDGAGNDQFGASVSVSGDTAVIGASYDNNEKGNGSGSAYVFVRAADGIWTQQAKLLAADGYHGDGFGWSVAVDGDTAVIGAHADDDKGVSSGSAYVFVRAADGTWTQQAKLLAADGGNYDYLGHSVAVDGDTAVIGAHADNNNKGSVYVFVRAADGTWRQQSKLLAADGAAGHYFGQSVTVDGDTAIIGAYYDDDKGNASGSAYVFVRAADGRTWTQQAKLTASDGAAVDCFGWSVAVDGDTAVIGARGDDGAIGSAYVFVRAADGTWTQQAKLLAADGAAIDCFGVSVSISGDTAVIGSFGDDDKGSVSGSAYVFVRAADGTWTQQDKLLAADGAAADFFGVSVSVSGGTAVIGARWDDDKGTDSGSAYVFGSKSNTAPVANAGPNQTAVQGDTVCFDGSGSTDADGDLLSYLWTLTAWPAGSAAVLDNPTVDKPCITADLPGTYQVSLTVNDGTEDSAPSTAEAVAMSCQDVAREAIKAVNSLDLSAFKNEHNQPTLTNKINEVITWINQGLYQDALDKLQHDILGKTDGCAASGAPDKNDWIMDCASQAQMYPLLQQAIVCVQRL